MRNTVRSLNSRYACLIAQAALEPIAEAFAERWELAMDRREPPPGLPELFPAVIAAGVPILSHRPIAAYLAQCQRDGRVPDPDRMVQAIVHALAELDPRKMDKTCRCPARRPLIERFG